MAKFRIGHGYDVHKLVPDRALILGGVDVPHTMGLLGHSDADVLVHAIMDAIIGALGEGDIGLHFPDTSAEYKNISSMVLLRRVADIMQSRGASIGNIDATLVLQRPKVRPYIEIMRKNVAEALNCSCDEINIKATTEEKLGFTGREEGVAAHSVALLVLE